MAEVMIWNPIYLILFGILITVDLLVAMQYFNVGKKIPDINEKLISYAYSFLFFSFSISIIFFILSELQIQGVFINSTFSGDFNKGNELYQLFFRLNFLFFYVAFIFFYYGFGRYKKQVKYLLLVFIAIGLLFTMILPFEFMMSFNRFYVILNFLVFLSILLIYTKWSELKLKSSSSFIFLGSIMMFLGLFFNYRDIKEYNLIPLFFPLVLYIIGALICVAPTIIDSKYLSNPLIFWKINGIMSIVCGGVLFLFAIIYIPLLDIIFLVVVFNLFMICSVILILKSIKTQLLKIEKTEYAGVLRSFSRPEKITEEEVSISKERKICLVCKGNLGGFTIFLCKNCGIFYCHKCAKALIQLENACWACGEPIDESKPVKSLKKDEIEIKVEEKIQKNVKDK